MTKEAILERIVEIMKERSRSEREFAKLIGVNQKTINQQIKQDRSLSLASLVDSKNLKEISPAGKIEMSASDPIDLPPSDSEMAFLKAEIAHLKENIEIKDELIISLKETIALLKNKQN